MTADTLILAASLTLAAVITATGTWVLLRLHRLHRTELERDRLWDEEHGNG